jgi:hypothetical protein
MTWTRRGLIVNTPTSQSFTLTSPSSSSATGGGFGSGGSTGGEVGNNINNTVMFSNMEVKYYKINLEYTKANIYGEAIEKWYYPANQVKCLIERGTISNKDDEFGVHIDQNLTISIPRDYAQLYNILPEAGDIVMDRERFYEISSVDSIFGTISGVRTPNGIQGTNGQVLMYVLTAYLTRVSKLNLIEYYQ